LGLLDQVGAPLQQPLPEVLQLQRVHVLLVGRGLVAFRKDGTSGGFVDLVFHDLPAGGGRAHIVGLFGHHGDGDLARGPRGGRDRLGRSVGAGGFRCGHWLFLRSCGDRLRRRGCLGGGRLGGRGSGRGRPRGLGGGGLAAGRLRGRGGGRHFLRRRLGSLG